MKILVMEDELKAAVYLKQGLPENGYTVEVAGTGTDGLHEAVIRD
jgi:two-component system copper resistance phosphate regulon response regulator CusR